MDAHLTTIRTTSSPELLERALTDAALLLIVIDIVLGDVQTTGRLQDAVAAVIREQRGKNQEQNQKR